MARIATQCLLTAVLAILLPGCATVLESSKYKFNDGTYYSNLLSNRKVFVTNVGDTTVVTPVIRAQGGAIQDTFHKRYFNSTLKKLDGLIKTPVFYEPSLDIDLLTIPFKYRPAAQDLPNQFNTNYNAALYIGYRADKYQLRYRQTPLGLYKRSVNHYGLSAGLFAGLGNTAMNEWVTKPSIDKQYDGLVFTKGIAAIVGVQNLNLGLALGFDNLLDPNRHVWFYENRWWAGLTLGVNLN